MNRDTQNALIRAHQNNINRYARLLATHLTDHERTYVHRRMAEERLELERLMRADTIKQVDTAAPQAARRPPRCSSQRRHAEHGAHAATL
jgi:hypothetical protein